MLKENIITEYGQEMFDLLREHLEELDNSQSENYRLYNFTKHLTREVTEKNEGVYTGNW